MYDYVWILMAMYDNVWLCITIYDYVWLFMTIYDSVWLCMTRYDYEREREIKGEGERSILKTFANFFKVLKLSE